METQFEKDARAAASTYGVPERAYKGKIARLKDIPAGSIIYGAPDHPMDKMLLRKGSCGELISLNTKERMRYFPWANQEGYNYHYMWCW